MSRFRMLGRLGPISTPPATQYVLLIAIGQSNMSGQNVSDPLVDTTDPRILQYSLDGAGDPAKADTLIRASDPLLHPGAYTPQRGTGPSMAFARALLPSLAANQKIVILPMALGGTGASSWTPPSGVNYIAAAAQILEFLGKYPSSTVAAIIHLQGEADMVAATPQATYESSVVSMFAAFRAIHPAMATVPVITGPTAMSAIRSYAGGIAIRHVHNRIGLTVPDATFIPDPDFVGMIDTLHYQAPALRLIGAEMFRKKDRGKVLQVAAPAIPTGIALEGRNVKFNSSDAPAYDIETSATGAGVWSVIRTVYPYKFDTLGNALTFKIPGGSGAVDVRVKAKGYFGASAPTSALQYTVPAASVPTPYWDLDFPNAVVDGSANITSIPSIGTNTSAWTPVVATTKLVTINGRAALNVDAAGKQIKKTGTLPNGSYTHIFAGYFPTEITPGSLFMGPGDGGNLGPTILSPDGIAHQATTVQVFYLPQYQDGPQQRYRAGAYECFAFTYDLPTGIATIWRNGTIAAQGAIPVQQYTVAVQRLFGRSADGVAAGVLGQYMAVKAWTSVLTPAQIQTVQAQVGTLYGVTDWGLNDDAT